MKKTGGGSPYGGNSGKPVNKTGGGSPYGGNRNDPVNATKPKREGKGSGNVIIPKER